MINFSSLIDPKKYVIVPKHKRTIAVKFGLDSIKRFFIEFPKTVFALKHESLIAVALNDNDEFCHLPLLNTNLSGNVCIYNRGKKNIKTWIDKFFTSTFKLCYDEYADSLNLYFEPKYELEELQATKPKNMFGSGYVRQNYYDNQIVATKKFIPLYKEQIVNNITNFYSNEIKLKTFLANNYFPFPKKV